MGAMKDTMHEAVESGLRRRREELLLRMAAVRADVSHAKDPLSADSEERATQLENEEVLDSIGSAAADELLQIDAALQRLATGRYGVCESCREPIEPQRLAAVPYTLTCKGCAERR